MKKYGLRVLVGLIAFGIGLSATIAWVFSDNETVCERGKIENLGFLKQNSKKLDSENNQLKSGKVEFFFKGFTPDGNDKLAEFVLINGTDKDVYYIGHGEGSYCTVDYKQKGKIKMSPPCCGTGLDKRTLKSGKEQVFSVWLPEWQDVNQVGFKTIGENNKNLVIWSNKF